MPSTWFRSVGRSGAITSMTFISSASRALRFAPRRTAASTHFTFRPCSRARAAQGGRRVVDDLVAEILLDVLASDADRRRRADVRLRSHGEQVGGLADPDAGGRCPRAFRRDVDDHRDLRRELGLVDVLHRAGESTRRVQEDHDRVVVLLVRALDLVDDVVGGDRIDVVVELDRENARLGGRGEGGRRNNAPLPPMRSKLPAESGFSRCKDAIKSPCQPSTTLPPWGGVVHEGLRRRSLVLAFPATAWGEATLVTREVPLPGSARSPRLLARALQPRRPPLEGLRAGRAPCAQDVRLERLARGRGRGGGPPGQRIE